MQSQSDPRVIDPKLIEDIERAWRISIGDHMLNNQTEDAVLMAKSTGVVLEFVADYLHSRGCSLVYLNEANEIGNSQNYTQSNNRIFGQSSSSTLMPKQNAREQQANGRTTELKKVKTETMDGDFNQYASSTSKQIEEDDDILFLSNELSQVVVPKVEEPLPAENVPDVLNVLLLCHKPYQLDLEDFKIIEYFEWTILQIIKDLEMNADLTGAENLIVMMNPEWISRGVMYILEDIDQLCEAVNQKWPNLRIRLMGLIENGSPNDASIRKFNAALEQNCSLHGEHVIFEDFNEYLKMLLPNSCNFQNDLTDNHVAGFLKQLG